MVCGVYHWNKDSSKQNIARVDHGSVEAICNWSHLLDTQVNIKRISSWTLEAPESRQQHQEHRSMAWPSWEFASSFCNISRNRNVWTTKINRGISTYMWMEADERKEGIRRWTFLRPQLICHTHYLYIKERQGQK